MAALFLSIVLALAVSLRRSPATGPAFDEFERHPANPVIGVVKGGLEAGWLHPYSVLPVIDGFLMWYGAAPVPNVPLVVNLASSKDGVTWTRYPGNPIVSPRREAWDSGRIEHWTVVLEEAQRRFVALYAAETRFDRRWRIGVAQSDDGKRWDRSDAPVLDYGPEGSWDSAFIVPAAVLRRGGEYWLYYWGGSGADDLTTWSVGVATSEDLMTWTRHAKNPVFRGRPGSWEAGILDVEVVELPDGLFMIYQGNDDSGTRSKLGLARSQDGVSWVRVGTAPFFENGEPGAWDDRWAEGPVLIRDRDLWRMYYMGSDGVTAMQIGLATARPRRLLW
ncbi:MAG: hypothetical protein HYV07_08430 [Deltaproteobacteria bacterium]|nr:hypothetical protein [Deltaproteobacteria bacterium]